MRSHKWQSEISSWQLLAKPLLLIVATYHRVGLWQLVAISAELELYAGAYTV